MKRALLIGIDEYDRFGGLDGCVNDVNMLEPLLSRNDDDSSELRLPEAHQHDGRRHERRAAR